MSIQACPTDIVNAPAELVWELLTEPKRMATWFGAKVIDCPDRPLAPGDRVVFGRFGMRLVFEVLDLQPPLQFVFDDLLPLGIVNHEVAVITPIDAGRCRVTFN